MRDSLHSHYDIIPPNIRGMIDALSPVRLVSPPLFCLDEAYGAVATATHAADIPDVHGHEAALSLCEDLHVQVELCSIE